MKLQFIKLQWIIGLRAIIFGAMVFLPLGCQLTQNLDSEIVPLQSGYLRGVLDNGLHYSIRANDQTEDRMAFYLAINAGSLQEEEDERGLAHFLEHMAFNGSEHFPGNSLVEFAQQNGMGFGAHLNAYTSFEETVYRFSLPSNDPELRNQGLYVMYDWLNSLSIEPEEVEKERGVVLSEWRGSLGFVQDYQDVLFPLILKESQFAERLPIGKAKIIQEAPPQRLRDFYEKWYNTNNALIVVVGDFDAEAMERRFREIFSNIAPRGEARSSGPERRHGNIPIHNQLRAAVMQHDDAPSRNISVNFKTPRRPVSNTVERMRQNIVVNLLQLIAGVRFAEAVKSHSETVAEMYGFDPSSIGNSEINSFTVVGQKGELKKAYQVLLQMIAQFEKYGVQQSEMDLALETLRSQIELSYNKRNDLSNNVLAQAEVGSFLGNRYNRDIDWLYQNLEALVAPIRLEQLEQRIQEIFASEDVSIMALAKNREDLPSEQELIDAYSELDMLEVAALQNAQELPDSLMQELPEPGKITSERELAQTGFTQWTLSNGLKVYFKSTDFQQSELQFAASRLGGTFSLEREFAPSSLAQELLNRVVPASGFSNLSPEEFNRYLLTLKMGNSWFFDSSETTLIGRSDLSELEELFQQIYLSFTGPQFSQELIDQALKDLVTEFDDMRNTPDRYTMRLAREHIYQNDPRIILPESLPAKYSAQHLQQAFTLLVPSAADFSFIFVGNLKTRGAKKKFRKYIEQYIASLPTDTVFTYKAEDNVLSLYDKGGAKEFALGPQDQSITIDVWDTYLETEQFSDGQDYRMRRLAEMLNFLLNIRLTKVLREDMGKTYSPRAYVDFLSIPKNRLNVVVFYNADPADVPELEEAIRKILLAIQAGDISDADFRKVMQKLQKGHEEGIQQNTYWINALSAALSFGYEDVDTVLSEDYFATITASLTKEDLQEFSRYLTGDRWSRYTMLPKK